jgi:hypothetical protein
MFLVALFSDRSLAQALTEPIVVLPPGGPIFSALKLLHQAHILREPPSGTELDDGGFEPGVLYVNNAHMQELIRGCSDGNLVDMHTGLYMLGTRDSRSARLI